MRMRSDTRLRWICFLSLFFGAGQLVISAILLHDTVEYQNNKWEVEQSKYLENGYDVFWNQFRFEDDILVVITPLSVLVALLELFLPLMFCYFNLKDTRKVMILWICSNCFLLVVNLTCFILAILFRVDTVGFVTPDYNEGKESSYFPWEYDKGQAYCGVIGSNALILFLSIILLTRWAIREPSYLPGMSYSGPPILQ